MPWKETSLYLDSPQRFCPHNFLSQSHAVERKFFPSTCSAEHGELIRRLELSDVELSRDLISLFIYVFFSSFHELRHAVKLISSSFHSLSGKVAVSGSDRPVSNSTELRPSQLTRTGQMRLRQPKAEGGRFDHFVQQLRNQLLKKCSKIK